MPMKRGALETKSGRQLRTAEKQKDLAKRSQVCGCVNGAGSVDAAPRNKPGSPSEERLTVLPKERAPIPGSGSLPVPSGLSGCAILHYLKLS